MPKVKLIQVRVLASFVEEVNGELTRFEPGTAEKPTLVKLPEDRVAALGPLVESVAPIAPVAPAGPV